MTRRLGFLRAVALLIATVGATASAQPSTFRITQVYSNLDGGLQYVELTESAGLNGQHRLAGLTLTSMHDGVVKRFTFPHDLPTDQTAHVTIVVSSRTLPGWSVNVGSLPSRFVATDGGTLEFAGVDRMSYAILPTDGVSALYRDGSTRDATIASDACPVEAACFPRHHVDTSVYAVEYHHAERDHYFLTASAPDIDALDSGRLPGWKRTGHELSVGAAPSAALPRPVCRFYMPPGEGDSHFFSAAAEECDAVRVRFPRFILESSAAFRVELPDATGACPDRIPVGAFSIVAMPVYRLWNRRADSNHRYTTHLGVRDDMLRQGWLSEGHGPMGVVMCTLGSPWD